MTDLRIGAPVTHRTRGDGVIKTIERNPLTGLPKVIIVEFPRDGGAQPQRCWPADLMPKVPEAASVPLAKREPPVLRLTESDLVPGAA